MKKVWVLPTLLTVANGFFGFLAIAKCIDAMRLGAGRSAEFADKMEYACFCVILSLICDSLDGWVARRLKTSTEFGAQLDSLCDGVTFGIVPGILFKTFIEYELGEPPVMLARYYLAAGVCFALCALLRLARFNVENSKGHEDHKAFRGLPSPGAAIVVIAAILFYYDERWVSLPWLRDIAPGVKAGLLGVMPFMMFALGALMVSRIAYPHFASALLTRKLTVARVAQIVVFIALFALEPRLIMFIGSVLFGFYGPVLSIIKRIRGRVIPMKPPQL
ncbi:MAG: CDP-alcohol phosphatidyltransferase family protein [Planctomycetota bacterium]